MGPQGARACEGSQTDEEKTQLQLSPSRVKLELVLFINPRQI